VSEESGSGIIKRFVKVIPITFFFVLSDLIARGICSVNSIVPREKIRFYFPSIRRNEIRQYANLTYKREFVDIITRVSIEGSHNSIFVSPFQACYTDLFQTVYARVNLIPVTIFDINLCKRLTILRYLNSRKFYNIIIQRRRFNVGKCV